MDLGLLLIAVVVEEQIESIDGFHVWFTAVTAVVLVGNTGKQDGCLFAVDKRNTRLTFDLIAESLDERRC
jgi:hypothetical protein